jgi:signal transduction histidine kinase
MSRLSLLGCEAKAAANAEEAFAATTTSPHMLVLTRLPGRDQHSIDDFLELRKGIPNVGLIVMGGRSLKTALTVLRLGADDYLPEPVRNNDLIAALDRVAHTRAVREQELAAQLARAQSAQDTLVQAASMAALSRLAANLAHEINNPLTPILGMAELLLEDLPADYAGRDFAHTIIASAQRIRDIVRSLLDFARPSAQQFAGIDLVALVHSTLLLAQQQLIDDQIAVEIAQPDRPLLIVGSAAQLKQILLLLIENARESMPHGGVLSISLLVEASGGGSKVAILLRDTGKGIAVRHLPYIFEPFYSTKRQAAGVGLGLAIADSLIRAHGGTITVDSIEGQGSTFRVTLPLIDQIY